MAIEVMVVDDSAVVRQVVRDILNDAPDINVFACVADPILARQKMAEKWPDVFVLDIEMPRMAARHFNIYPLISYIVLNTTPFCDGS